MPMVTMPFFKRRVLLPRQDRHSALAGMALAGASRPAVLRAHRLAWGAVSALGPRCLPRAKLPHWPVWVGEERGADLLEDLSSLVTFDAVALRRHRRPSRQSLTILLIRGGRSVAFVRVKPEPAPLDTEAAALEALAPPPAGPVRVPRLLGRGTCAGLHWLTMTALPFGPHTPAVEEPVSGFESWLGERLHAILASQAAPGHWTVCHGDLTPWNLRQSSRTTWLLDWEAVTWGPPTADRTYFRATSAAIFGTSAGDAPPETVEYWLARVRSRHDVDESLNRRLLTILPTMSAGRPA